MTCLKAKMAAKAEDRMSFLKSIDTSAMTDAERERHEKFMELTAKRESVRSKMKFGIPDQQTIREMMEVEMQLMPLAKAERATLARELARELSATLARMSNPCRKPSPTFSTAHRADSME